MKRAENMSEDKLLVMDNSGHISLGLYKDPSEDFKWKFPFPGINTSLLFKEKRY